jgi:hypothetical protein
MTTPKTQREAGSYMTDPSGRQWHLGVDYGIWAEKGLGEVWRVGLVRPVQPPQVTVEEAEKGLLRSMLAFPWPSTTDAVASHERAINALIAAAKAEARAERSNL